MKILRASIEDAEEILSLQKTAYLSEAALYNNYNIPPLKQTTDEINNSTVYQSHNFESHVVKIVLNLPFYKKLTKKSLQHLQ